MDIFSTLFILLFLGAGISILGNILQRSTNLELLTKVNDELSKKKKLLEQEFNSKQAKLSEALSNTATTIYADDYELGKTMYYLDHGTVQKILVYGVINESGQIKVLCEVNEIKKQIREYVIENYNRTYRDRYKLDFEDLRTSNSIRSTIILEYKDIRKYIDYNSNCTKSVYDHVEDFISAYAIRIHYTKRLLPNQLLTQDEANAKKLEIANAEFEQVIKNAEIKYNKSIDTILK